MKKSLQMDMAIAVLLAASVLAVFWPLGRYDFVRFDDDQYVLENPHVASGLSWENSEWAFTTFHAANWHPLTWISLMVDAQWSVLAGKGIEAGSFHRTNVVLHSLNAALVFLLFVTMTQSRWPSLLVAALFGLHPLHVESVAWIAERKDVLSTFFGLLSLLAFAFYAGRPRWSWYVVALAMFVLSLLAKQMLVTLPALLVLLDYWPLRRYSFSPGRDQACLQQSLSRLLLEKLPFLIIAIVFCGIVVWAQQHGNAVRTLAKYPLEARLANAAVSYVQYLKMTVWPRGLAFFYPFSQEPNLVGIGTFCAVLMLAISVAAVVLRQRYPYVVVGWLWYLGTLLPVIGIVQVGDQALADRYTYISLLGIFTILAWGLDDWVKYRPSARWLAVGMGSLAVLASTWLTADQIRVWRNSESLFLHAIKVTTKNEVAHNQLAYAYKLDGRYSDAIRHYQAALAIRPDAAEYHSNLGSVYIDLGQMEMALHYFREAERQDPNRSFVLNNLAWIFATSEEEAIRKPQEAIRFAERACALETRPNPAFLDTLAVAYASAGRFDDAVRVASEARKLAESMGLDAFGRDMDGRIALFRAGKPYVEKGPK